MAGFIGTLVPATIWPTPQSLGLLIITTVIAVIAAALSRFIQRPALPRGARPDKGWPIVGSPRFFTARDDFLREGKVKSSNGHFSFYYGKHPIVAVYGEEARLAMLESRGLDLIAAVRELFAPGPDLDAMYGRNMSHLFKSMLREFSSKSKLDRAIPGLVRMVDDNFRGRDFSAPMDPFADLSAMVYSMIHRVVGCTEIAENPEETLNLFLTLSEPSAAEIMFPGVPIPSALTKLWSTVRIYRAISNIVAARKRTGRREEDVLQSFIDNGESNFVIFFNLVGAASVAQANTSMQISWLPCYLAQDPYWYERTRAEVDGVIAKYRTSADESPADVLSRLTVEKWEAEFPVIHGGIHDSIRLTLPGTSMRKNISGKDIALGGTGVVVPPDAFVLYPLEDVHLDPRVYEDPHRWDPSRYMNSDQGDRKASHSYLGWGSGLHPCVGTKIAKLLITVSTALFVSHFDFCLSDEKGNPTGKPLPLPDMNVIQSAGPVERVFLKCERRIL